MVRPRRNRRPGPSPRGGKGARTPVAPGLGRAAPSTATGAGRFAVTGTPPRSPTLFPRGGDRDGAGRAWPWTGMRRRGRGGTSLGTVGDPGWGHGDRHTGGRGDRWDTGMEVHGDGGTRGQAHVGMGGPVGRGDGGARGRVGHGESHTRGRGGGWDTGTGTHGDVGTRETQGQPCTGMWGWVRHGDSHTQGCGDQWDTGMAVHWDATLGMWGQLGHGDTGASGCRDVAMAGDMGKAIPWHATLGMWGQGDSCAQGHRDGWDTGTATPQGVGTATLRDLGVAGTWGQPCLGTLGQPYSIMLCMGMWGQLGHGDIAAPSSLCPQVLWWLSARPRSPRPPRRPCGTMNVLAPVRRDRVIADLPPVSGGGTHNGPGVTSPSPVLTSVSPFVPPPVFSEGGRPAHPLRLPLHGGQRLPGAADGHRGVSPGRFGDPHPRAGGRGCVCVCDEEPTAPPAPGGGSPARAPRGCRRCPCAEPCVTAQECNAGGTRGSGLRLVVGWERRAARRCWTRGAAG